jgi:hypothetical protein
MSPQAVRTLKVPTQCPECRQVSEVMVDPEDYAEWKQGVLIQNAFPYLSNEERERLITGICGKCWDKMFGEEDLVDA